MYERDERDKRKEINNYANCSDNKKSKVPKEKNYLISLCEGSTPF